jgi:hypothetical protein
LLIEVASSSASSSLPLRTDAAATREPIAPADSCVPGSTHSPPGPAERRVGSWPGRTPSAGLGRPGRRQAFSASTDKVTFDNAEGAATLATLSELGRTGAFKAGDEIGSPGTIAPDTTARRVTYSGNAGTYTVDQAASNHLRRDRRAARLRHRVDHLRGPRRRRRQLRARHARVQRDGDRQRGHFLDWAMTGQRLLPRGQNPRIEVSAKSPAWLKTPTRPTHAQSTDRNRHRAAARTALQLGAVASRGGGPNGEQFGPPDNGLRQPILRLSATWLPWSGATAFRKPGTVGSMRAMRLLRVGGPGWGS